MGKLMGKMNQLSRLNASRFIRKDSSDDDGPLVAPPSCQPYDLKYGEAGHYLKPASELKTEKNLDDDMTDLYGFGEALINKGATKKVVRKTEFRQTSSRQYNNEGFDRPVLKWPYNQTEVKPIPNKNIK